MAAQVTLEPIYEVETLQPLIFELTENGAPIDLTGATFCMDFESAPDSTTAFSLNAVATDPLSGIVTTDPLNFKGKNIKPSTYYADFAVTLNTGETIVFYNLTQKIKDSSCQD